MTKFEQWSLEEFDAFCRFASSPCAKLPLAYIKPMGLKEAAFLAVLINHIACLRYGGEDWWQDGWFYFPREYAQRMFGLSAGVQLGLITKLKKMGLIQVKQIGIHRDRHIRLNIKMLQRLHVEWWDEFKENEASLFEEEIDEDW